MSDCLSRCPIDPSRDYDDEDKQSKSTQTEYQHEVIGAVMTRQSSKSIRQVHPQLNQPDQQPKQHQPSNQQHLKSLVQDSSQPVLQ